MASAPKSLKAQNLPWLVSVLVADAAVIALIAGLIDIDWFSAANLKRASSAAILPVIALLLTNLFPQAWRDRLAHLRWTEALPGHRAFTEYGPADTRVDMNALARNCGALPSKPGEQNKLWYKLYREVGNEPSVAQSHQRYLLFRDLGAMSLVLLLGSSGLVFAFDWQVVGWAALLFVVQLVLCAATSRNTGIRFVTNVLVLHSSKDGASEKAARKRA
jgi:hypothetical protein